MKNEGLSRFLSQILRHTPENIGVKPDDYGYVDIDVLIVKAKIYNYQIQKEDIMELCKDTERFIIKENRIRAVRGHSFTVKSDEKGKLPPKVLYHSTSNKLKDIILTEGLKPMKRSSVYLFEDYVDAYIFADRNEPAIIVVNSEQMYAENYQFYSSGDGIWFTDNCPPKYLSIDNNIHNVYKLYKKKATITTYYKKLINADYVIGNNHSFGYFGLPVRSCWMCKKHSPFSSLSYHFEKDYAICQEYDYALHAKGKHKLPGLSLGSGEIQNENFIMASVSVMLELEIQTVPDIDTTKGGVIIGIDCPCCGKATSTGSWSFGQGDICKCTDCGKNLLQVEKTEVYIEPLK